MRARLVKRPEQWRWSSYRASAGMDAAPPWLATDWLLGQFARRRKNAQGPYVRFVAEGLKAPSIWGALRGQIFLDGEGFAPRWQLPASRVQYQGKQDGVPILRSTGAQLIGSYSFLRFREPRRVNFTLGNKTLRSSLRQVINEGGRTL